METLYNKVLYLVMYLSTKSGVYFQTAWALADILAASLSVTYLDVAIVILVIICQNSACFQTELLKMVNDYTQSDGVYSF